MIIKMLHLDLVTLAKEKDSALEKLRDMGAVHLDLSGGTMLDASTPPHTPRCEQTTLLWS